MLTFYKRIGYKTIYSKTFVDCHLLILPRPTESTIIPSRIIGTPVHIWNYVGSDLTGFFEKNKENIHDVLYLSSSEKLVPASYRKNENWRVLITKPPVYPKLWTNELKKDKKFNLAHIGNLKPYIKSGEDTFALNFLKSLKVHKAYVWGRGWEDEEGIIKKGMLEVMNVSEVYASTRAALGLMYPFQRQTTFSGRFWHGPLNGAIIISEPGAYTVDIPGVYNSDLTPTNVSSIVESCNFKSETIQEESIVYWNSHTKKLEEIVKNITESFHNKTLNSFSSIHFYKNSIDNTLRTYYRLYRGRTRYIT